jgi:glycosyltransferase involved in cell wall biosynthesis
MVDLSWMYDHNLGICFIAHFAYGALAGGKSGKIGGVERQTSLMAKWFAKRGCKVSMLTWDEGQEDGEEIDGVKVFKMCRKDEGIKGLRFFWPRWTSLNAAMKRANADIYYQNCGEYVTGQVALWCRRNHRKFVYSVANDTDCDICLPEMHTFRERLFYRYGLKHADSVIVQTRKQQDMLQTGFKRDSIVIPMPCNGLSEKEYTELMVNRSKLVNVLWIGRICEQKRPDRLLELAKTCPDIHFDFVGPKANSKYADNLVEQAKQITNITYHGPAIKEQIWDFYRKAKIFLCTSDFEGFPNTFLEAWSCGLPIISTFDPDNIIAQKSLGKIGKNVSDLSSGIYELLKSSEKWESASNAARQYYVKNHAIDAVMPMFEQTFQKAFNSKDGDGF